MTKLERISEIIAEAEPTPVELAERFCQLDDEQQADFFIACARIMASWPLEGPSQLGGDWQAFAIGRHLATRGCSTEEARDWVRSVASGIGSAIEENAS